MIGVGGVMNSEVGSVTVSDTYKGFSIDVFNRYLNIDFDAGAIKWKTRHVSDFSESPNPEKQCNDWNRKFANKVVGGSYLLSGKFYRRFTFFGKTLHVCKVIYLCYYGSIIFGGNSVHLDHINGNSLDDSVFNLRYISSKANVSLKHKTRNKNGYVGVVFDKGRFYSKIIVDGKTIRSKKFDSALEAHIEYILMRKKYVSVSEYSI